MDDVEVREPPDSPRLRRAHELFQQALTETVELLRSGQAVREARRMAGAIVYEFPPVSEHLRLVVGDCFQSLRAALDHEVYSLTAARHGRLAADSAKTAFPIADTDQAFRSQGMKQIRGLSASAQGFIERVQRYKQPPDPIAPLLALIHDIARVDRHRLLNLAAAQPRSIEVDHAAGRINLAVELRYVMSEHGAGVDILGAVKQAVAAVAWTIDELREADAAARPS